MPPKDARPPGGGRPERAAGFFQRQHVVDTRIPPISQPFLRHLRRQRQVERLHALGARAVCELLDELARHHGIAEDIDQRVDRYARLDPSILAALGGDRFPHPPLHLVGGGDG